MKKILVSILIFTIVFSGCIYAANVRLSDISGHWAETYIKALVEAGVVNGYEDGTYKPEGAVKKGEFIKLMMTSSLPDEKFLNVNRYDHWASPYIECAEDYGVISSGLINDLNANDPITRAEVVEILGKCDITLKGSLQDVSILQYADIDSLSNTEYIMLSHCTSYGYIQGYEDGTFRPDRTLTRAEIATILYRYINHISNEISIGG